LVATVATLKGSMSLEPVEPSSASLLSIREQLLQQSRRPPASYRMVGEGVARAGDLAPVFLANARLQKMAKRRMAAPKVYEELLPLEGDGDDNGSKTEKKRGETGFTPDEVARAMEAVGGSLNPSQKRAVKVAIARPLSLIQGPPGTGKVRD
jgi:hypothetical protein